MSRTNGNSGNKRTDSGSGTSGNRTDPRLDWSNLPDDVKPYGGHPTSADGVIFPTHPGSSQFKQPTADDIWNKVYKDSEIDKTIFQGIWDNSLTWAEKSQYYQLLLQYIMSELDYQRQFKYNELSYDRSRAYNQVAQMMEAGMSRSAALAALQNGSTPQSAAQTQGISPYQPAFTPADLFNTIIGGVGSLANIGTSLATLPATITAKKLTNDLLSHQGALLGSQVQGLNDAALFQQAVANAPEDVQKMHLYEQVKYFQNQSKLSDGMEGFNLAANAFGNSAEFGRCLTNPFFYAAVNNATKDSNLAAASVFEPEKMRASIQQMRACAELADTQEDNIRIATNLLENEEFISDATLQARSDLENLRIWCESEGLTFDGKRAEAMVGAIQSYTTADYLALKRNLQQLRLETSPEYFQKYRAEIMNSLSYNAMMYLYGYSLTKDKYKHLTQLFDNDGNPIGKDPNKWINDYFRYQEFGGAAAVQAKQGWWRTGISGVSAASVLALGGYKIWSGVKAASAAAGATAGYTISNTMNLVTPLVVPTATLNTMPILPSLSEYGLVQ